MPQPPLLFKEGNKLPHPNFIHTIIGSLTSSQKISGNEYVTTALRYLSEIITVLCFGSTATPRVCRKIPFGPPIVHRAGTSPLSCSLQTPTNAVSPLLSYRN